MSDPKTTPGQAIEDALQDERKAALSDAMWVVRRVIETSEWSQETLTALEFAKAGIAAMQRRKV